MMEGGNKHGRVIPTNFGLKYNPPKLGIQYYFKENPKATFVHEVSIDNATSKKADELINDLFAKHKKFIDPKVVSRNQLENLMDRLKSNLSKENAAKNKENLHENSNNKNSVKSTKVDSWGLDNDIADFGEEELSKPQKIEKDIFSGAGKEEQKNNEKEFILDDFDMDNEDQKINENHDMFDGLDDDLGEKPAKQTPTANDEEPSNAGADDNDDDDSDAIDIDNEEELAARGLKKIQIEGEEEEFLMDAEGNIYDLNGDFIGTTTNGDVENEGEEDF